MVRLAVPCKLAAPLWISLNKNTARRRRRTNRYDRYRLVEVRQMISIFLRF